MHAKCSRCWGLCGLWWWSRFLSSFAKKKRVLGYAGTVIRLPQSPHQQTVKGFSPSLGLFNLLQCLRSLCILLTLLDISARLRCRQSHLSWTRWGTRNWKVDREGWQPGHEGEWIVSSMHQWESDYTQWAHYQSRKLSDSGVMKVSWQVMSDPSWCHDMSPQCHWPLNTSHCQSVHWPPVSWHLREAVQLAGAGRGWEWL